MENGGYKFPPDYTPSQHMLDEVGMDFDDDLGGLKRGAPPRRSRLHLAWLWLLFTPFLLLFWAAPAYVFMFMAGMAIGAVGVLILDIRA